MNETTTPGAPVPPAMLHAELVAVHWDTYKEAHGVRPRWINYGAMTVSELEAGILDLSLEADLSEEWSGYDARIAADEEAHALARAAEAHRAHVERWMDQAATWGAVGW